MQRFYYFFVRFEGYFLQGRTWQWRQWALDVQSGGGGLDCEGVDHSHCSSFMDSVCLPRQLEWKQEALANEIGSKEWNVSDLIWAFKWLADLDCSSWLRHNRKSNQHGRRSKCEDLCGSHKWLGERFTAIFLSREHPRPHGTAGHSLHTGNGKVYFTGLVRVFSVRFPFRVLQRP